MNRKAYKSMKSISIGDVEIELVPEADFQGQRQALDAMLIATDVLAAWAHDNTLDPDQTGGKQEKFEASVKDGQRQIATIRVNVPTTSTFGVGLFQQFVAQTLVPALEMAAKAYISTRSGQQTAAASSNSHLTQDTLHDALEQTRRVKAQELRTR